MYDFSELFSFIRQHLTSLQEFSVIVFHLERISSLLCSMFCASFRCAFTSSPNAFSNGKAKSKADCSIRGVTMPLPWRFSRLWYRICSCSFSALPIWKLPVGKGGSVDYELRFLWISVKIVHGILSCIEPFFFDCVMVVFLGEFNNLALMKCMINP